MIPTVALVGRPNVGKSTLFNKMTGKKISIIEDTPGVTRDRIYEQVTYEKYRFNLIDTGGIDGSGEKFNTEIRMQAEIAIDQADVVVFVVDGKEGLTSNDLLVRDILRKSKKRVITATIAYTLVGTVIFTAIAGIIMGVMHYEYAFVFILFIISNILIGLSNALARGMGKIKLYSLSNFILGASTIVLKIKNIVL